MTRKKRQNLKRWFRRQKFVLVAGIVIFSLIVFNIQQLSVEPPYKTLGNKPAYGLALGYTLPGLSQLDRVKLLRKIELSGFKEVRFNLDWSVIQKNNSKTYDWKLFDTIMKDVKNSGMKSIVTLDRTPQWARPSDCTDDIFCPPQYTSDFATFSAVAVKRYQGYKVAAWEIWNEPNIVNFWRTKPDAVAYTQLLAATYTAIKKQVPSAVVLVGGLAGDATDGSGPFIDPRTFIAQMYASGAKNYFDGIAYHPYTSLRLPNNVAPHNGWPKMVDTTPSIRSLMADNKDQGKGIWITEFGNPTSGKGVEVSDPAAIQLPQGADHISLEAQKQIAEMAIADITKYPWVKDFDWYTYADGNGDYDLSGSSYGLFRSNGTPKPVFDVIKKSLK
jgi:polysaccharide biosynthesis protein PslG